MTRVAGLAQAALLLAFACSSPRPDVPAAKAGGPAPKPAKPSPVAIVCEAEARSGVDVRRPAVVRLAGALWWAQELSADPDVRSLARQLRALDREQAARTLSRQVRSEGLAKCPLLSLYATAGEAPPDSTMALVDGGPFWMGCDPKQHGDWCLEDAQPLHQVVLSPFEIDIYEVSEMAYKACMDAGSCPEVDCDTFGHFVPGEGQEYGLKPASCITWAGADAYCRWVGAELPTEAQWEKAARGTDARSYPWGNEPPTCERAWSESCRVPTEWGPAARYVEEAKRPPSPYGVFEMSGNIAEWVADWYAADAYQHRGAPDPRGPSAGAKRIARGGSWNSRTLADRGRGDLLVYNRDPMPPDFDREIQGFRCARAVLPAQRFRHGQR